MASFISRYSDKIRGTLSCYDRVVIQGILPGLCYAQGMTSYLYSHNIRIFDYARFAEPLRDVIRENAERLAAEQGIKIEFVRKLKAFRKEKRIAAIIQKRGTHPGLVHILSGMETCVSYKPWHDKKSHKTFLIPDSGKCLHYYFYFIDPEFGLCYLRVPTWCPFRLQFYFNGHNQLAAKLRKRGVDFQLVDNAFVAIDNWRLAQRLADEWNVHSLHQALDRFAKLFCPIISKLGVTYHWSIMQVERATDIVFSRQEELQVIYDTLTRTAIHTVKPEHVATFLGRKLTGNYQDELGNDFNTRIEGTRIKHHMGPVSIKMYDKFGLVLRIETTANDVTFFRHHRMVEQRDGTREFKLAAVKKSIYSLQPALRDLLCASNQRYLDFISEMNDPSSGIKALDKISTSVEENGRTYKGFNFFSAEDQRLFEMILRGEFNISGMRNSDIRSHLIKRTSSQVSHLLKRLRMHGLIKKIGKTYKYYLTNFGRHVALAGLKLKHLVLIPSLC
ncbi:MAG: helix-turn-helix transcriptional regulator [Desulfovibrio sp.]|nr:helix-turn-helix transcriptional regulator [Desulfovibrio sp.]